jgi:lipid-binding SYLF domain-containing protein
MQMTTTSAQADVHTYVYGQKGMLAGISLQGITISTVGD